MPSDWDSDGFGFSVFARTWRYAPLLLIDGCTLPFSYMDAFEPQHRYNHSHHRIPLVIGVTRQESDFSPQDDVRNMSIKTFSNFIISKIRPSYGSRFADQVVAMYVTDGADTNESFDPQRVYAEIVTDATILCPNAYLASKWRPASSAALYLYVTTQRLEHPFCVLEPFNPFIPPYCPLYSFHAVDMFAWFSPLYNATRFNYTFTKQDHAFGQLVQSRFVEFANNGAVGSWMDFSSPTQSGVFRTDSLPLQYHVVDMKTDDVSIKNLFDKKCNFWLKNKFYETKGLIN